MGSGPTRTTNQNQTQSQMTQSAPWAPAQAGLATAADFGVNAFNNTYNTPSIPALDQLVTAGQNLVEGRSAANYPGQISDSGSNNYLELLKNYGLSPTQTQAISGLDMAQGYLTPYANGTYLQPGQNPYLEKVLADTSAATAAPINAQFSAAGRYGSPAQAGTEATAIGKVQSEARMADYNQQQQNQQSAIQQLAAIANARAGIGQAGVGNIGSAVSAIPTLAQGQTWAGTNLQGIGADKMNYLKQVIDAANQDPWTRASNLANLEATVGQQGGTQYSVGSGTTNQQQTSNPGIFGDILAGIGAAGNLVGMASGNPFSFGQFGRSASDLINPPTFQGAYGSPFGGLSDRRAKENIQEVGILDNGLKLYTFTYKAGGPPQLGLMAQEVEGVMPDAVWTGDDGLKRIDYGRVAGLMAQRDEAA
jgi:hypothetical protein